MKKIKTFLFIATIIIFASCESKNAREFNDKLVNMQKDIVSKVELIVKAPGEKGERLKTAKSYIDKQLEELKKIPPVKGGEAFKQAMVDDIDGLSKTYTVLVKMTDSTTTAEENTALTNELQQWETKINTLDKDVMDEQRKFAKDKGFKLEYK